MKPPAMFFEGVPSDSEETSGNIGAAGVTPLADISDAALICETGKLPMEAATWQESARSATAVVSFVAVPGTDGGVTIAAASIS